MSFIEPDLFRAPRHRVWPFGALEPQAYSLVMIDCAWHFEVRSPKGEGRSPQAHYRTMSLDDIAALPVADLAAPDCLLWMWATAPLLHRQIEILATWGFEYATSGTWVKTTRKGKLAFGGGYSLRNCHEPFLIGKRGAPNVVSKSIRSTIMAPRREHSRKPDEAYEHARRLIPHGRAADVYSRETRPGWESFGDQAGKFDA